MTQLLQSTLEKERASRNARILADYKELTKNYPAATANRKLRTLAEKYQMTAEGIRKIVKANGLYKTKKQEQR